MAVCTLLNIGVLLTNTMNMLLSVGYGIHFRSLFDLGWCRVNVFIAQWIRGMASWFLVVVAFDRFRQSKIIRRTPARDQHTVSHTIIITSLLLLITNLHYLLFTGEQVPLSNKTLFLACIFHKNSENPAQRFFASTNAWQELVTIIIVVSKRKNFPQTVLLIRVVLAVYIDINIEYIYHQKVFSQSDE